MHSEQITDEQVRAEEQHTPKRTGKMFLQRFPLCLRICLLLVLMLFGLHLLTTGPGAGSGEYHVRQQTPSGQTGLVSGHGFPLQVGLGAGATSGGRASLLWSISPWPA
jgi:hypothetical protein